MAPFPFYENSEQQLVDCSTVNYGCNGGWYEDAWKYVASAGGQSTSASYPYTAVEGTCKANSTVKGATLSTKSPVYYVAAKGQQHDDDPFV